MAVTGGAAVWSLAAGLRLERLDIGGKAVSRVAEDGQSPSGSGQICRRPAVSGIKKRTSKDVLFLCVQAEDSTVFRERLQPSQLHVIFGDVPRCSLLCGSGGDHSSRPEKSFFRGGGERERGEGQFLQKTSLPPLVQKSVAETIRRRRRSRRRRRDWRRFRPGGPDGRPPACADGCPGDGCIRSRRCAPDGGRR